MYHVFKAQLTCQGAGLPLYSSFLVAFLVSKILYSILNLEENIFHIHSYIVVCVKP